MICLDARPMLASGVRLRADRVRGGFNLLAPEHVLRINASSAAILNLCDGTRRIGDIAGLLADEYEVERVRIERDVLALIADLASRRMVET
ncbi:pyrroloquinoline quinone biosynthesis peptide chaperone PqqD [Bosea sp. (in: a-proteobacteria)]|uniref:pyrroloquinoline quinone biosynthesis peptide chaperone PqqD n=1 Tax=Bosea sp. (in: a-proteobacteria) TaxID=1871050 RepID=UPI002736F9CA|nr:pyrroloquinoline quinone biosynthesis peptide chaperone PqqD [Bosea sp. (in: a-proteobacteria)]MDP3411183.1 pyrroloquinoline quinone biosynthesis peptide chaperone PqqD [Bosea sp. (in: a-proteobacteria)]